MIQKLRVTGTSFKRYREGDIMRHTIELHLEGEIPHMGLGFKNIIKLLKKSMKDKYYLYEVADKK